MSSVSFNIHLIKNIMLRGIIHGNRKISWNNSTEHCQCVYIGPRQKPTQCLHHKINQLFMLFRMASCVVRELIGLVDYRDARNCYPIIENHSLCQRLGLTLSVRNKPRARSASIERRRRESPPEAKDERSESFAGGARGFANTSSS